MATEFNKKLGNNIKRFRLMRGMTQETLARKVGYARATISRTEGGSIELPCSKLAEIAKALCVSPVDLIYYEGEEIPQIKEDLLMVSYFNNCTKKVKNKVKNIIRFREDFNND